MRRFHVTARDDEDDTRLFEAFEDYILQHYPNPQRIGCLEQDALRCLVETPQQLDLGDPKYLHVFACAECTLRLGELLRQREVHLQQEIAGSPALSSACTKAIQKRRSNIAAAAFEMRLKVRRFLEKLRSVFH